MTKLVDVQQIEKREMLIDGDWRRAVKARLAALGVHQADLAHAVGTSQSQISFILAERGRFARRSEYVERISVALDVPLPYASRIERMVSQLVDDGDIERLRVMAELLELDRRKRG